MLIHDNIISIIDYFVDYEKNNIIDPNNNKKKIKKFDYYLKELTVFECFVIILNRR